jgi:hypothetical protein
LSSLRAPIEKIAMFGMPTATLCRTAAFCSALSGKRSVSWVSKVAPGIAAPIRSCAYSQFAVTVRAGP